MRSATKVKIIMMQYHKSCEYMLAPWHTTCAWIPKKEKQQQKENINHLKSKRESDRETWSTLPLPTYLLLELMHEWRRREQGSACTWFFLSLSLMLSWLWGSRTWSGFGTKGIEEGELWEHSSSQTPASQPNSITREKHLYSTFNFSSKHPHKNY